MADETLDVRGGVGGITASYADMLTCAAELGQVGDAVGDHLPAVHRVVVDGDVIASAPLSPRTAAAVTAQAALAADGPSGLLVAVARIRATALTLEVSVTAYRTVDEAQTALATGAEMVAVGPTLLAALGSELPRGARALWERDFVELARIPGLTGQHVMDTVYANPWMVDGLVSNAPVLMNMLAVQLGPVPASLLSAWALGREGVRFPPSNLTQATGDLVAFGGAFGLFRRGVPEVEALAAPAAPDTSLMKVPQDTRTLFEGIGELGGKPGTVRVFSVVGADGVRRWTVQIPGTQEWSPTSGPNPVDLTNNVRLMAGQQTEQNEAIRAALRQAGVRPGEPVLLAGHSQGGITAASLAADPATRSEFTITNVVTGGSPVAGFAIPPEVSVLSLEHQQDAVPRLDGGDNPDRPGWVTVVRDPTGLDDGTGNTVDSTGESHNSRYYADTAGLVDASEDPSIAALRESLAPFLDGRPEDMTVQEFQMTRKQP